MTPLRQRMLQDVQMRNLSPHTQEAYIRAVAKLAAFSKLSPDRLDLEQVRNFLVHLVGQQVSFSLFNQVRCALVLFYRVTLGCQKREKRLPVALLLSTGEPTPGTGMGSSPRHMRLSL